MRILGRKQDLKLVGMQAFSSQSLKIGVFSSDILSKHQNGKIAKFQYLRWRH
jgi:hypothetical protein